MATQPVTTKVKVTWDDILAQRAVDDGVHDGILGAAEVILTASNQLVPFATGHLMSTGQVDFDLKEETAHVYYDTVYAAKLHQNPKYHFQGGRRGKYLSTAAIQGKTKVLGEFDTALKFRFRRGGPPKVPA